MTCLPTLELAWPGDHSLGPKPERRGFCCFRAICGVLLFGCRILGQCPGVPSCGGGIARGGRGGGGPVIGYLPRKEHAKAPGCGVRCGPSLYLPFSEGSAVLDLGQLSAPRDWRLPVTLMGWTWCPRLQRAGHVLAESKATTFMELGEPRQFQAGGAQDSWLRGAAVTGM